jgi:cytochrome oxidase Cu insertion factor (SCO1/SenC/PrrC family)
MLVSKKLIFILISQGYKALVRLFKETDATLIRIIHLLSAVYTCRQTRIFGMLRTKPFLMLFALVLLAACSPAAVTSTLAPTQAIQQAATPTAETLASGGAQNAAASNKPAWLTLPLINAHTGETFTLADFAGKTVWVEPMATWCTTCRGQLPHVEAARIALNSDQYAFISFSVAENVDNATLAKYADDQGWHWIFAVATTDLTQGLVDSFGFSIVTPPSTPHFIIKPDGSISDLSTGKPSTDEIVAALKAASGAA